MWRTPSFPMHDGLWAGRGLMFCGGLLLLGLLVLAVAWLIVISQRRGHIGGVGSATHHPLAGGSVQALQIARERYARGEVSREEFLQIKADLEGSPHAPQPPAAP